MAETTTYILAFAALLAAGVLGVVVLPATERGDGRLRPHWFAGERGDAAWRHASA